MSAKTWTVRSLALAAGISMLAAAAVTQSPALAPAVAQTATDETLTPAQPMLQELPSVADLADRLLPAVVEITIESSGEGSAEAAPEAQPDTPPSPGGENPDDPANPFKDFFDEFLKRGQGGQQPQQKMTSMGSGFVVDPSGIIVTNNHVVEGAESIEVHFSDDTVLKAELVGRDPKTDLAVIRVKPEKPLPVVAFGDSDKLRVGEWVMAIGSPFGLENTVTAGIVSAKQRDTGDYLPFIQTDVAINPGNSGGPLFNMRGEVVGITNMKITLGENVGFAIPARYVKDFVRHREAFAFDKNNPNSGHFYHPAPPRPQPGPPSELEDGSSKPAANAPRAVPGSDSPNK